MPGEVQKLENALIRTEGRYVGLCVAEDSTAAAELVEQALDPETDAAGALVQTA